MKDKCHLTVEELKVLKTKIDDLAGDFEHEYTKLFQLVEARNTQGDENALISRIMGYEYDVKKLTQVLNDFACYVDALVKVYNIGPYDECSGNWHKIFS